MAFKRASLSGSGQLFEPTRVPQRKRPVDSESLLRPSAGAESEELPESWAEPGPRTAALLAEFASNTMPQGHLYRLTSGEVELLLAALQHAKFPHSYQRLPKPAMEEFEQLEALRQKLSEQREVSG
jgi:hypothetical protein